MVYSIVYVGVYIQTIFVSIQMGLLYIGGGGLQLRGFNVGFNGTFGGVQSCHRVAWGD